MTNKLPEVGKRYRYIVQYTIDEIIGNKVFLSSTYSVTSQDIDEFWDYFEELPDSQEKPEVQLNKPIVSEVEKAKEELRYHAGITQYFDKEQALEDIKEAAKNLIDALENQEEDRVMEKMEYFLKGRKQGRIDRDEENQEETKKEHYKSLENRLEKVEKIILELASDSEVRPTRALIKAVLEGK